MKKEYVHDSELNLELQLMTEIMKLESLHYGYWEHPTHESLTLDTIKEAQHQYTISLHQFLPGDVESILDVGCGIGDNARYLASQGYNVTALSPDDNHKKFFDLTVSNPRFIQSTIEELDLPEEEQQYDLVLMSESQNYFDMDDGLRQARRYLRDGGYLLISGNFAINGNDLYSTMHNEAEYVSRALAFGFHMKDRQDITPNILPTLTYTRGLIDNHLVPALKILGQYFERQMPLRSKLAKFFLGGQIQRIDDILDYYHEFLDEQNYIRNVNYVRTLFELQS